MSSQMSSPLPIRVPRVFSRTAHACFANKDVGHESVPDPEPQEEAPDSNPDGRSLQEAEPDGLEVEISLTGKFH